MAAGCTHKGQRVLTYISEKEPCTFSQLHGTTRWIKEERVEKFKFWEMELSKRISMRSERVLLQVESCIYMHCRAHLICFLASGGAWFISEGFSRLVQFNSGFKCM